MKRWLVILILLFSGCIRRTSDPGNPRLVMFVGVDISGSFVQGKYFDDSLGFLAHYLYSHLNGLGGLEAPHSLFVGPIGGSKKDEAKTFFPIQTFSNTSLEEITKKLKEIFPKTPGNALTDYNAFFDHVAETIKDKKLVLKPISVVMLTDGKPDLGAKPTEDKFRHLNLRPLEQLSRNVTVRVLYTDATTAKLWHEGVPRKRVKIWTQDALVMSQWSNPNMLLADTPIQNQKVFFEWIRDNVDFHARLKRVD